MPPKNKKQAEQQAKRLQQQRKKKEQEQAQQELERKKYAGQTIETGIFLPTSNQLILDFSVKSVQFITEKLEESIKKQYENLSDAEFLKGHLIKELHYYIKDSRKIFRIQKIHNFQGNQAQIFKVRVFIGIMFKVMLNQSPYVGGTGKNKAADERIFKQLLASHAVNKYSQRKKVFETRQQIQAIMKYASKTYFAHFLLMKYKKSFEKRIDRKQYTIHMTVPAVFSNSKQTPWTDLTKKQEYEKLQQSQKNQNNKQAS